MAASPENAFTIGAVKQIIAKYGKRVRAISTPYTTIICNLGKCRYQIGDQPWVDTDKITFYNVDGYDVMEFRNFDFQTHTEYTSIIRVGDIIGFQIVDDERQFIDPFRR